MRAEFCPLGIERSRRRALPIGRRAKSLVPGRLPPFAKRLLQTTGRHVPSGESQLASRLDCHRHRDHAMVALRTPSHATRGLSSLAITGPEEEQASRTTVVSASYSCRHTPRARRGQSSAKSVRITLVCRGCPPSPAKLQVTACMVFFPRARRSGSSSVEPEPWRFVSLGERPACRRLAGVPDLCRASGN
jgi:hypothetical protein